MTREPAPQQIDERLTTLLAIEQRLEARFREAEAEGQAQVDRARVALQQARDGGLRAVEALAAAEARAETTAHEVALRAIEAERNDALTKLSAITDAEVDRLARKALTRILEPRRAQGGGS